MTWEAWMALIGFGIMGAMWVNPPTRRKLSD